MSDQEQAPLEWRAVRQEIAAEVDRIWIDMPIEIQKIRWGVIDSGAGSGGQSFTVLVHLEAFMMLMGANVLFRFLKMAQYPDMSLEMLVKITRNFLVTPFDVFEFMEDLGLTGIHALGLRYGAALDVLENKDDYIELTGTMMTYVIRLHRWIHFIFPWNLGVAFRHRSLDEIQQFVALVAPPPKA